MTGKRFISRLRSGFDGSVELSLREVAIVAFCSILFFMGWAVLAGQDVNWDLRNYHYYNVFAWFHGRTTYDIAPAQRQSWLNPLVHVPSYLLIAHTRPVIAGALLGVFAGVNFVLIYVLTRLVVRIHGLVPAILIGLLCAIVGVSGPEFLIAVGRTSSDTAVSIPVLGSLLAICWGYRPGATPRAQGIRYWLAGLLLGAACGLKLTAAIYVAGFTMSLLLLWPWFRFHLRHFAFYAAGGILGFLATGGYWSWFLWAKYRNPVFPFYNDVFHSPWAEPASFQDTRFLPKTVAAAIRYPFDWLMGLYPTNEVPWRDGRFALLFILILASILALAGHRVKSHFSAGFNKAKTLSLLVERILFAFLLLSCLISYALWIAMFSIQRYLMPLGLLSGLVLFLALDRLLPSNTSKLISLAALALFCVLWTRTFETERIPYGRDWFGVELTPVVSVPNTLFIMAGGNGPPISYVIPFLPSTARVMRLSGNMPLELGTQLGREAIRVIATHAGPIRTLGNSPIGDTDRERLACCFGLLLDESDCVTFHSHFDEFTSCRLRRAEQPISPGRALGSASP